MFDLGWTELLVIGVVALIVVGPKDLPMLFRNVGRFVGKAKGMAREFTRAMDEAADQSGMKEAATTFRDLADPKQMGLDKIKEVTDDVSKDFKAWDPMSPNGTLDDDRAASARKIHEATAKAATDRKAPDTAETPATSTAPKKAAPAKKAAEKLSLIHI